MGGEVFFCQVHGEIRQGLGGQAGSRLGFSPRLGRELFDLGDLGCWQAREQIFQVIERIDSVPPTTAQQRLNHCAAFPGFRMACHRPWRRWGHPCRQELTPAHHRPTPANRRNPHGKIQIPPTARPTRDKHSDCWPGANQTSDPVARIGLTAIQNSPRLDG